MGGVDRFVRCPKRWLGIGIKYTIFGQLEEYQRGRAWEIHADFLAVILPHRSHSRTPFIGKTPMPLLSTTPGPSFTPSFCPSSESI